MAKFISKAERLTAMKTLNDSILPSTLKHEVLLPNIKAIKIEYRNRATECGPAFQFLRKYGPSIRFRNPDLKLERVQTPEGAMIVRMLVYGKNVVEP